MLKIDWCEGGLQLADIGTKNISEHDITPIALTKLRDHVGEHLFEILEFNYVTFCVI